MNIEDNPWERLNEMVKVVTKLSSSDLSLTERQMLQTRKSQIVKQANIALKNKKIDQSGMFLIKNKNEKVIKKNKTNFTQLKLISSN